MGWFSKDLTDHNNDGQKDASEGKPCVTPHFNPVDQIVRTISSDIDKQMAKEDDAYKAGYNNAKKD